LSECGFTAMSLSGEMDQAARNRALASFKRGDLRVLVATDVAARGIDVQDIARVVHAEPPSDADSYTHRSGRTGRAGRKGTSSILVALPELSRATYLLKRAGVAHRFEAIPSAEDIRVAAGERVIHLLDSDDEDLSGFDDATWVLAKRIASLGDVTRAIARLLGKTSFAGPTEPRNVRVVDAPAARGAATQGRAHAGVHSESSRRVKEPAQARTRPDRSRHDSPSPDRSRRDSPSPDRSRHDRGSAHPSYSDPAPVNRPPGETPRADRAPRAPRRDAPDHRGESWVAFRVSWGQEKGADARRLLAVACRRGQIRGSDVGSIRVERSHSVIDIASGVAEDFARAAAAPDPRDPHVIIRPEREPKGPPPSRETSRETTPKAAAPIHVKRRPGRSASRS
ncbi:MAG: helicase-related protein, partial [Polyangiaceae bacterium]